MTFIMKDWQIVKRDRIVGFRYPNGEKVVTSPIKERGDDWAITESGTKYFLYPCDALDSFFDFAQR